MKSLEMSAGALADAGVEFLVPDSCALTEDPDKVAQRTTALIMLYGLVVIIGCGVLVFILSYSLNVSYMQNFLTV